MSNSSGKTYSDFQKFPPLPPVAHRTDLTDQYALTPDAGTPAHALFLRNTGHHPTARIFVTLAFVGGYEPELDLGAWVRSWGGNEASSTRGQLVLLTSAGPITFSVGGLAAGSFAFDVPVDGDDLCLTLDDLAGAPTETSLTIAVSWRP